MKCCTCPMCRRSIRRMIERYYDLHPSWIGVSDLREAAGLSWLDFDLYLLVFRGMVKLGQLVQSYGPGGPYPLYISGRVLVPAQVLAETVERGQG